MSNTLKFGSGQWATKVGSTLAYNDENGNFKPLPFNFERAGTATRVNKEGLIEVVSNNEPRIDFSNDSKGALLLEPQRTNLITNSEKFVDAPIGATNMDTFGGTITNNSTTSPDNNTNGMKFTIGAGSSSLLRIYQSDLSTTLNTTFSIYAKKGTSDSLSINISGGTPTNSTLTDEWQRISTTDISDSNKFLDVMVSGNSGEYIYIFGLQLEQGSYATSYIPTQGSAVTRDAEVCNGAGNEQVFNDNEGVLFAEISALANDQTNRLISLTNGTSSERISLFYSQDFSNEIKGIVFDGGVATAELSFISNDITDTSKIALKYKQNNFALWVNGIEVVSEDNGTVPSGLNKLAFDLGVSSTVLPFYGNIKDLRVYNIALTDAELISLTS